MYFKTPYLWYQKNMLLLVFTKHGKRVEQTNVIQENRVKNNSSITSNRFTIV